MKSKDSLQDLFQKVDLSYDHPDVEEAVMKKINRQAALYRLKEKYILAFKFGFSCLIFLGLLLLGMEIFSAGSENKGSIQSYILYPVFILLLWFVHLEMGRKLRSA